MKVQSENIDPQSDWIGWIWDASRGRWEKSVSGNDRAEVRRQLDVLHGDGAGQVLRMGQQPVGFPMLTFPG